MSLNEIVSQTAIATASLRALACYEPEQKLRCNDDYAKLFLPKDQQDALKSPELRDKIKKQIPKGMFEYVIVRTKYFDNVFNNALKIGTKQIVFLGAGFDSRAYQFNRMLSDTKIFELDAKATQEYKMACLQKNDVDVPQQVSFIPTNFEKDDSISILSKYGYDKTEQTLFLWEGVTFYLFPYTVKRMLRILRMNSGKGSRICFDFQAIQKDDGLIDTGLKNEVIKFGIEIDKIDDFVQSHKYSVIEHITSEKMEQHFLTSQNGSILGRIMPMMNILLIEHE